jgi:fructose-specific phosphotransferase system IIC component
MKALFMRILHASRRELLRVACVLSLVGLTILVVPIVAPGPLLIILSMSVGHAIGGVAFACYVLAVVLDAVRSRPTSEAVSDPGPWRSNPPPE